MLVAKSDSTNINHLLSLYKLDEIAKKTVKYNCKLDRLNATITCEGMFEQMTMSSW